MSGQTYGYWIRCTDLPCSLTSTTLVDTDTAQGEGFSSVVDVLPSDGAVFLQGISFVAV